MLTLDNSCMNTTQDKEALIIESRMILLNLYDQLVWYAAYHVEVNGRYLGQYTYWIHTEGLKSTWYVQHPCDCSTSL